MPRLVVISGPPNTAKLAKAWEIAAADPDLRFLHRDQVRVLFGRLLDEAHLTQLLGSIASTLLAMGYGVVTAGQNLAPSDQQMWAGIAERAGVQMEWVRTDDNLYRDPDTGMTDRERKLFPNSYRERKGWP